MLRSKIKKTLTNKIRSYMVFVGMGAILIYFILSTLMYISSYARIESVDLERDGVRIAEMIQSKSMDLQRISKDYGIWDEAADRLKNNDTSWFKINYSQWIPKQQDIELVAVISKDGRLVDQHQVNENAFKTLMKNTIITRTLAGDYNHDNVFPHGMIYINDQLYILAVSPVMKIDGVSPSQGIVILGRPLDQTQLRSIQINNHDEFALVHHNIIKAGTMGNHALDASIIEAASSRNKKDAVTVLNQRSYISKSLTDLAGNPIGSLVITSDNASYKAILLNMNLAGVAVAGGIMAVVLILSASLAYSITRPLEQLRKQIDEMGQSSTLGKVVVNGTSEIEAIAEAFNDMSDNFHKMVWENEQFKNNQIIDGLTGLYNQRYLYQYLGSHIQGHGKAFHVLLVDVDYFKKVNASFGHQSGDRVLQLIAEIIRNSLDEKGVACRYSGEEFMIVTHTADTAYAFNMAEDIRKKIHESVEIRNECGNIPVTVSIGLTGYPEHGMDVADLLDKADKATGMAKKNGRNTSWLYSADDVQEPEVNDSQLIHRDALMDALMQLVVAVDNKENYYTRHSEKVAFYAEQMGVHLLSTERERYALHMAAMLHDCGKITVPESIIEKTDVLSFEEFQVVRMHPEMGCNLIQYSVDAPEILLGVRHHHERWDGKGYPDALAGDEIPLFARIISVADAYQSITSDRPYRMAKTIEEAVEEMKDSRGKQFDPEILDLFLGLIEEEIRMGSGTMRM